MRMRESPRPFSSHELCTITSRVRRPSGKTVRLETCFNDAADDTIIADGAYADAYLRKGAVPINFGYEIQSCQNCNVCVPMRIILPEFKWQSVHRNALRRNEELKLDVFEGNAPYVPTDNEFTELFHKYSDWRFAFDGTATVNAFDAARRIENLNHFPGLRPMHLTLRDHSGVLRGCNIFHVGEHSAYDTGFFYDPAYITASIGHALSLRVIEALQARKYTYMYAGYLTRQSTIYSWKDKFYPMDLMLDGQWKRLDSKTQFRPLRENPAKAYPPSRIPALNKP